jgi:hypothetical protein
MPPGFLDSDSWLLLLELLQLLEPLFITDISFEIKAEPRQSLATFARDESNNECYD